MTILRLVVLLAAVTVSNASVTSAQRVYCDASMFNTVTNMWREQPDENTSQVPAGDLAAERSIMQRVKQMFQSAFVPTGAAGLVSANYNILPHAVTNTSRYGNTYSFTLSHQKIECLNDKPVPLDVSYGNVTVHVNSHLIGEAEAGDAAGFSVLPRGYYQLKDATVLPRANAEGIQEFNFRDGTTVWWLTKSERLPFRLVTQREFLNKQIEILRATSAFDAAVLAHYKRLLSEATDDVAYVTQARVPGLTQAVHAFTSLQDPSNRIYVTVNGDYYDRSLPKSTPQHILIRLRHADMALLNRSGNGPRHLESFQQLREVVRANLPDLRSMVR
ncbi:MAG TPA: hypothetical protein VMF13_19370 [Luteitalea sp.]|nr:hypothetical protein [Luteitalea sp.]